MNRRAWLISAFVVAIPIAYLGVRVATSPGIVDTKMDRARYEVILLSDALEDYRKEHGRYPTTEEGLLDLVRVGLLRAVPVDPWQRPYEYRFPGSRNAAAFDVWSYGADGKAGGVAEDKDIGNWGDDA